MQGTWENGRFVLASTKDAQIAALREERDRLAEELVEARKPDCRTCARLIQEADGPICSRAWVTRDICVDGNHYEYQPPLVRLYENAALAGTKENDDV